MERQDIKVDPEILIIKDQITEAPFASLQPVVVNIRNTEGLDVKEQELKTGQKSGFYTVAISKKKHTMFLVDGQHRTVGFERILIFLNDIIRKGRHSNPTVLCCPSTRNIVCFFLEIATV
jgi:hypothetical protein